MSSPPDEQAWRKSLQAIRNARSRLFVCFLTFPLYIMAVNSLLRSGQDVRLFMILYMLLYAGFGIYAATRRCPRCHQQYYVKSLFLNIFVSKCQHCSLPLHGK